MIKLIRSARFVWLESVHVTLEKKKSSVHSQMQKAVGRATPPFIHGSGQIYKLRDNVCDNNCGCVVLPLTATDRFMTPSPKIEGTRNQHPYVS